MTLVEQLAYALRCLPGVGPKSAQRMVFHLLKNQRSRGLYLAACLEKAMNEVHACQQCRYFAEQAICSICADEQRDLSNNLPSEEARKNYEQLASVIDNFPEQDSDPRYVPLPPQTWDVEVTAKSQVWKK